MCSLIGASPDALPSLRSSLETLGQSYSLNVDLMPAIEKAYNTLNDYCKDLVAKRRETWKSGDSADLLDMLVEACHEGRLSDEELYGLLVISFIAGYDTSKNVLTLIMHTLLDRPDDYARCAEDVDFCADVVEEIMRYKGPATVFRTLTADIVYRDVLLPKGTVVLFPVSLLSRDPKSFPDPDTFNPERLHDNRHMGFGRGAHICLGQYVARAQIAEGLHVIAQRITKPKLAGPINWRSFWGVWGLRGLPIEFTPAPALH
jgi:cytochrome P450